MTNQCCYFTLQNEMHNASAFVSFFYFVRNHTDAFEFVKVIYEIVLVCFFSNMLYFIDMTLMMSEYVDSGLVGCENINMYLW